MRRGVDRGAPGDAYRDVALQRQFEALAGKRGDVFVSGGCCMGPLRSLIQAKVSAEIVACDEAVV